MLAILSILVVIAASSVGNITRANEITQGAELLQSTFSQARQTAIARNRTVEVRLYRYRNPRVASDPAAGRFYALQTFIVESTAGGNAAKPASRVRILPKSVYLADDPALSSLLDPSLKPHTAGSVLGHSIPGIGTNYTAVRLEFFPDGSTNLDLSAKAYLTLVPLNTADGATTPPANFATLLLQPLTGKTRIHRP